MIGNDKNPAAFVFTLLALFFAFLLFIALFNVIIDPAGIYEFIDAKGFNSEKTALMEGGGRGDKAKALGKGGFDTIILGTSRSELGIDPESPILGRGRTYNASLAGSYVYEIERAFAFAKKHNDLKRVILSLDFLTFYRHRGGVGDFDESGFASGEASGLNGLLKLIAVDEFLRSFETLKDNLKGKRAVYTRLGRRSELGSPAKRTALSSIMRASFVKGALYARGSYDASNIELIRSIIKECRASGIELTLFISPAHALLLEHIRLAGAYRAYEDWERALAKLIAEDAAVNPGLKPLELWDFSGYNSITNDDFPEPDFAPKEVKWFWEPAHYNKAVGDMVLRRIFQNGQEVPEDFGRLINAKNIEAHLAEIRAERERYRQERPKFIKTLERLWQETEEERKASLARGEDVF